MSEFAKVWKEQESNLDMYVPIVARVHGASHPEFLEVRKIYDELRPFFADSISHKEQVKDGFGRLKALTTDYTVPNDVCETYEAVYGMLQALDQAFVQ